PGGLHLVARRRGRFFHVGSRRAPAQHVGRARAHRLAVGVAAGKNGSRAGAGGGRRKIKFHKCHGPVTLAAAMLSPLRKLLGHEDKFHDLLEASAEEALASTKLLANYLQRSEAYTSTGDLDDFILTRRKDKKITRQISEELARTFVTPIEREDIEALSVALYRVPKTVEKLVERLSIYPGK